MAAYVHHPSLPPDDDKVRIGTEGKVVGHN